MEPNSITQQDMSQDIDTSSAVQDSRINYTYKSFPNPQYMRLLNVNPSTDFHGPILCSMEIVNPKTCGPYSALSYRWGMNADGDSSLSRQVFIDGKVKLVTQNLYEGLRRLRAFENGLRIWIDAVCINQADSLERNAQVAAMAPRFANAAKVFVWLGEGSETHSWFVRRAIDYLLSIEDGDLPLPWDVVRYGSEMTIIPLYLHYEQMFSELNEFLGRRYFTRLWVVQELLHARTESTVFLWGSCHLSRASFEEFVSKWRWWVADVWRYLEEEGQEPSRTLESPRYHVEDILSRELMEFQVPDTLPRLVLKCRPLHCIDPRDKLYALVSLDPGFGIEPDYTIPVSTLFVRFATLLVGKGWIDYIFTNRAPLGSNPGFQLPTWVPDVRYLGIVPSIDHTDLKAGVRRPRILTYTPYLLGTVIQNFDDLESLRRRQRPCIIHPPKSIGDSSDAISITFDEVTFSMAKVDDLVCFIPTLDNSAVVQIVRQTVEGDGFHYWVSNFESYDYRFREWARSASRITLNIT